MRKAIRWGLMRQAALGVLALASLAGVARSQQLPLPTKPVTPPTPWQAVVVDRDDTKPSALSSWVGRVMYDPSGKAVLDQGVGSDVVFYLATDRTDPALDLLGVQLAPLSAAMRAQLNIGEGAYVVKLRGNGPCARAGLKAHDVLVAVGEHSVKAPEDFPKYLRTAGEGPVALKVIRGGKADRITVKPVFHVSVAPAPAEKKEFYLGVSLQPVDEALRAQLSIPAGRGVMISDVVKGSPAAEAGLKAFDIILEFGEKMVESPEKFSAQVQAGQDKPAVLKILRAGARQSIKVTPAVRVAEHLDPERALGLVLSTHDVTRFVDVHSVEPVRAWEEGIALKDLRFVQKMAVDPSQPIEELRRQVRDLEAAIRRLENRQNEGK